jgi:hypothetical protein
VGQWLIACSGNRIMDVRFIPDRPGILMFNLEFMAMEFEKIKSEWDVLLKLDKNLCFDIMDKNKKIDELKTQVSYLKDTLHKYEPNELH